MKHFRRPFLLIANGIVVLSSALFFLFGIASRIIESMTKKMVPPEELANPAPFEKSDAMIFVDFIHTVGNYCWFFGILFFVIGLVNFWLIPWKSLKPASAPEAEDTVKRTG